MIAVIAEHIKTHRHQLRKHALFIGSAVRIPPADKRVDLAIEQMAIAWAGERVAELDEEERAAAALDLLAREVPDHAQRCRMLLEELGEDLRPAEGHVRLTRLIKDGYYSTVFIAEPDDMLERALSAQHMEPEKDYHLLVAGVDDPQDIKVALEESTRLSIIKCAGDLEQQFLPLSRAEVSAVAADLRAAMAEPFKLFSVFVALSDREKPLLLNVPREGARIFWINKMIPMGDAELYDELKLENPGSAQFHRYQPDVTALLEARHSSRHLLCREPGSFNEFFAKLHGRLIRRRRRRRGGGQRDLTVLRGGPYRFLDFFDVEDADFYFGREDDVKAVLEKMRAAPMTVVFGKTGVGKTSLLRAGIMAALRRETEEADKETQHPWLVAYTRVGDDPRESIRSAILAAVQDAGYDSSGLAQARSCPELACQVTELTGRQIVVLLDQFAEYFVKLGDKVRRRAVVGMRDLIDHCSEQFRILIAIREDFVGELFELQSDFPQIMHNMHRLHKLTRQQAEDATLKPAQNFELQIERKLVYRIVEDLNRDGVEPAQLQIVLHSLYESLSPGGHVITEHTYDGTGGAKEILDTYLDRGLSQLPASEKRTAGKVLVFMASGSELKASRTLGRIADEVEGERELIERVLAHLVDMGVLRPVGRGRQREYELVHEILADKIQAELAGKQVMLRDIQDLLTRELNSYQQFGLLTGLEELKLIGSVRDDLVFGPEELKLIVRSALTEQVDPDYWFARVWELREEKADFIAKLVRDDSAPVRLHTYQHLGEHLAAKLIRHLVHGLDDDVAEIRELAATYLKQLDRHLLSMLDNRDHRVQALAARALGITGDRRVVRPLIGALSDDDPGLRDEIVASLLEIDDSRTADALLRALQSRVKSPWATAYALGKLAVGEGDIKSVQRASKLSPQPELNYALGVAHTQRRNFTKAAEMLEEAKAQVDSGHGPVAIGEAADQLEAFRVRTSAGEDAWLMFGMGAAHGSCTSQEVRPDLELAWQFNTRDHVVASPVVRDNTVYIGSRDKRFYAIDTGKGTTRWTFEAAERIEGAAVIAEETVCFGALDGVVYGLDLAAGDKRWQTSIGSAVRGGCVLCGDALYIGSRSGDFVRLDVTSGRTLWHQKAAGEISSAMAVANDILVLGCWDGNIQACHVESGETIWRHKTQGPVSASPAISDGVVYCGSDDSGLYALDLQTGGTIWRAGLGGQVRCAAALAPELAVVGSLDGKCYAVSRADGSVVWSTATEEDIMSSPAISGEIVYVSSRDGGLYALDISTGEIVWRHKTSYGIYSSPAVAEQTVFVGLGYYGVAAFRPKAQGTRAR